MKEELTCLQRSGVQVGGALGWRSPSTLDVQHVYHVQLNREAGLMVSDIRLGKDGGLVPLSRSNPCQSVLQAIIIPRREL